MVYKITSIGKGTLYAMPCPASGQLNDILTSLRDEENIDRVISLLEEKEAEKLGVAAEAEACKSLGLTYQNYPIRDFHIASSQSEFSRFIKSLYDLLVAGDKIVVHCYAGIGRTGLVVGSLMILDGVPAKEAIDKMSEARGRNMPQTQDQYEYLINFGERVETERVKVGEGVMRDGSEKRGWLGRIFGRK